MTNLETKKRKGKKKKRVVTFYLPTGTTASIDQTITVYMLVKRLLQYYYPILVIKPFSFF